MTTPALRVVGGGVPTDEELAAVVAVVALLRSRRADDGGAQSADRWRRSQHGPQRWRREPWLAFARRTSLRTR